MSQWSGEDLYSTGQLRDCTLRFLNARLIIKPASHTVRAPARMPSDCRFELPQQLYQECIAGACDILRTAERRGLRHPQVLVAAGIDARERFQIHRHVDRKSTRLNSSH